MMHLCKPLNVKRLHIYIIRFIAFLVALQILNMGLFVQDFEPFATTSVTPQINIINTIDEYIAEVVLNHKDAVPEGKDSSKKDIQLHKHIVYKCVNISRPSFNYASGLIAARNKYDFSQDYFYRFFQDINPPPPKA